LLLLFTFGASALWSRPSGWARLAVVLFCGLSLFSCLSLRFSQYYGVPVATGAATSGEALYIANPTRDSLNHLLAPGLIIASKADLYDSQMALAEYIRDQGYSPTERFAAFVVWERKRY
jgi:hypothetical protein